MSGMIFIEEHNNGCGQCGLDAFQHLTGGIVKEDILV